MYKRPLREKVYKIVSAVICVSMLMTSGPVLAAPAPSSEPFAYQDTTLLLLAWRVHQLNRSHVLKFCPTRAHPQPRNVDQPSQHIPSVSYDDNSSFIELSITSDEDYASAPTNSWETPVFAFPPSPPNRSVADNNISAPGALLAPGLAADIPLSIGWNLISIPEKPSDTETAAVLELHRRQLQPGLCLRWM